MTRRVFAGLRDALRAASLRRIGPGLALVLLAGIWPPSADAQSSRLAERRVDRSLAAKDAIRHRQVKRAYVAGAIAQHRRERVRDLHEDRYRRDRYYRDHRDGDDDLSRMLIGVAVGAVATSIIMNSNQDGSRR